MESYIQTKHKKALKGGEKTTNWLRPEEQHSGEFPGFSFCPVHLRLGAKEAREPKCQWGRPKVKSPNKSLFCIATGVGKSSNSENVYPVTALLQTNTKEKKNKPSVVLSLLMPVWWPSGEPRFPPSRSCNEVATQGVVREGQIGSRDFHLHWVAVSFSSYALLGCVRESPVKSQLFHHNTALMMTTPSVAVGHAGRNKGTSVSPSQDGISGGLVGSHNFHLLPIKMKSPYYLRCQVF